MLQDLIDLQGTQPLRLGNPLLAGDWFSFKSAGHRTWRPCKWHDSEITGGLKTAAAWIQKSRRHAEEADRTGDLLKKMMQKSGSEVFFVAKNTDDVINCSSDDVLTRLIDVVNEFPELELFRTAERAIGVAIIVHEGHSWFPEVLERSEVVPEPEPVTDVYDLNEEEPEIQILYKQLEGEPVKLTTERLSSPPENERLCFEDEENVRQIVVRALVDVLQPPNGEEISYVINDQTAEVIVDVSRWKKVQAIFPPESSLTVEEIRGNTREEKMRGTLRIYPEQVKVAADILSRVEEIFQLEHYDSIEVVLFTDTPLSLKVQHRSDQAADLFLMEMFI